MFRNTQCPNDLSCTSGADSRIEKKVLQEKDVEANSGYPDPNHEDVEAMDSGHQLDLNSVWTFT
jgi:hypothetical protein